MKIIGAIAVMLSLIINVAYPQQSTVTSTPPGTQVNKQAYTQDDIEKLKKDNKILMLDFSAVWCQPCKEMAPIVDEIEKENPGKIKVVRIDYDVNRQLANNMYVYEIPYIQVYVDGKIWQNIVGMMPKDKIMELIPKQ